eukprot:TRINITY_DN2821_c0_g1_i1.p1 TRINITY_DN2821_c0_g1~~TRINITY_DN2821_c0_g1_i1.p1  ORF type:complete len:428 (+),score=144.51 TRINITY_DN2821_c0_g1_i1:58-1341(+)
MASSGSADPPGRPQSGMTAAEAWLEGVAAYAAGAADATAAALAPAVAAVRDTGAGEVLISIVLGLLFAGGIIKAVMKARLWWLGGGDRVRDYVAVKLLGSGGFGEVHRAQYLWGSETIALKIPYDGSRVGNELRVLRRLNPPPAYPSVGFPKALWVEEGVIAMELLGPSLANIKKALPEKKYSLKSTILIADQLISRLQFLHTKKALIHRDIKPENLLLGLRANRNVVHICDFGLTTAMYDARSRTFKPYREGCAVYGTPYFTSVTADAGIEQSMRDDLESMAITLVYLAKGTLPWIGLRGLGPRATWHHRLTQMKRNTSVDDLCAGLPSEFAKLFTIARGLKYTEFPPYDYLKGMFHRRYAKLGFAADEAYDWTEHGKEWRCWTEGGSPFGRPDEELEGPGPLGSIQAPPGAADDAAAATPTPAEQ